MSETLSNDPNDYCFIDTETKAGEHTAGTIDEDVGEVGSYRYAASARVIIITYAIGEGPVNISAVKDFDPTRRFIWSRETVPPHLWDFYERAKAGKAWFVAWHAVFDRLMLSTIPLLKIEIPMMIDAMAQAAACNLPLKLQDASKACGGPGKQEDGKDLIKLFCRAVGGTPQTHPEEWERFKAYAARDINELRRVFNATRRLSRSEWEEYWVSERINERGMKVDVDFAKRAAQLAAYNREMLGRKLAALTNGEITAPTQAARVADWLSAHADPKAAELLISGYDLEAVDGSADKIKLPKYSVASANLEALLTFYNDLEEKLDGLTHEEMRVCEVAEARYYGANSAPGKFQVMLDMIGKDHRLRGQYRFNGGGQTGRFSSTDVQVHNLVRASLADKSHPDREAAAIEMIMSLDC